MTSKYRALSHSAVFATIAIAALPVVADAQTTITVNTANNRKAINPNIYGTNHATQAQLSDLNSPLNRNGGNNTSRYNWTLNADNRGSDWFFESIADASSVAGERGNSFVAATKNAGGQPMLTIPMLPYIAKLGANRSMLWSFSKAKYGNQTQYDQWQADAGNGISTAAGNPFITGNNPLDANVANSVSTQQGWLNHLISSFGMASAGGVKYYVMDNEPGLWHATHRDVHPTGQTMDELLNLYKTYALMVRNTDPNAIIVGPEEWGWTNYLYSGYDSQWGSINGWSNLPDRAAHGGMDQMPWLLQQLKNYQNSTGKQLLNVFSLHFYPQGGEFSNDDSAAMRSRRNRSTRALWDPNYVDETWINTQVQLIPRMKNWVATYYPGLQTGITEYNWGNESQLNGATAQADIFGIFGREGLDMGCRWATPATNSPAYLAMKIWRNYDGNKNTFGNTSVQCTVPNPDNLSAFAAERSSDGALTVMVINKLGTSSPITVNFSGFTSNGSATRWQISSATQTSITQLSNISVGATSFTSTVPAQSITLFVLPKSTATAPQYDFEGSVQSWTRSGAPISSVAVSTTQKFTGTRSLAVNFSGGAGTAMAYVSNPTTPAGRTVTFRVWIPSDSQITAIQPYVQQGAGGGWTWTGNYRTIGQLTTNAWNTITVVVPSNAVTPLYQLGVQFTTGATWTGTCYIDSVSW